MKLKLSPRSKFPGRGLCLQLIGSWVTEKVWLTVNELMHDNLYESPVYRARTEAGAFFQGGHDNPRGKWVLLEFSAPEERIQPFLDILEKKLAEDTDPHKAAICIVAETNNDRHKDYVYQSCELIAQDTGCRYERDVLHASVVFYPEDNLMYDRVRGLCQQFSLKQLNWLDKWEVEESQRPPSKG